MNQEEQLNALKTYFNLMTINGSAQVFHIANQFKIFSALATNFKTSNEIAEYCNIKEKPLILLLDVLSSLKVIEKQDNEYSLSPVMQLLAGNYQNLGNPYWEHLPEFLKTNTPFVQMDNEKCSEELYKSQITALDWMMKPSAITAAKILGIGNERKSLNILDVGAGSGVWSLTFVDIDCSSTVTAIDWPAILEITKKYFAKAGLEERFNIISGNYHEVDIPDSKYDMAILGNVTHIETPKSNVSLFKKIYSSLKENGELIIFDVFPGQEIGDIQRTLYALGLALRTKNGRVYSPDELKNFLIEAGYKDFSINTIPITPYIMGMLIAKK